MRPFVESRGVQELSDELSVGQIKRHAAFNDDALNLHVKKISIVTTLQQRHAWRIVAHPHVWHSVQSRRFGNVQSTRVSGESAVNNRIYFTQSQLLLQNSRQHGLLHACMR